MPQLILFPLFYKKSTEGRRGPESLWWATNPGNLKSRISPQAEFPSLYKDKEYTLFLILLTYFYVLEGFSLPFEGNFSHAVPVYILLRFMTKLLMFFLVVL